MIRCPKCGEINKDGSRFCNGCGEPLQRTRIRCPLCGTMNQVGAVFCEHCHARLVPATGMVPPEDAPESESPVSSRASYRQRISLPTRTQGVSDTGHLDKQRTPDWLRDLLDSNEQAAPADEGLPGSGIDNTVAEEPASVAPDDLTDWLGDATPVAAPEPVAPEPHVEEEDEELPDWLAGLQPDAEPAESQDPMAPDLMADDEELPDWLGGATPVAAPEPVAPEPHVEEEDEELPDWLAGLPPVEESEASGLGDVFVEVEAPADIPAGLEETDDVPEWLTGIAAEKDDKSKAEPFAVKEEPSGQDEAIFKPSEPENVEPAVQPEEVQGVAAPLQVEADLLERTEIPVWLQTLGPTPVEGLNRELPQKDIPLAAPPENTENLTQADLPSWLHDLKPPGTEPLVAERTKSLEEWAASTSDAGDLDRAEIPAWVQDLRPSGDARETTALTFREEPLVEMEAEEEGLLAGLRSVLPAFPGVDVPDDFVVQPSATVPARVDKDAKLWQELLERPHGEEHTVIQARTKSGWGSSVIRVGVFVLLSLTVLVAILGFLPAGFTQWVAQTPPPAVQQLQTTVASLEPGDTVILALEYGPAEMAEMTHLTEALLSQLLEREVRVVAVSTLPTGEPLIQAELDWAKTQIMEDETRELVNTGYLPGGSTAVAQFLADSQSPDLLLVLSARPERLQWWLEQNALLTAAVPMGIGASAALGPLAKPYFDLPAARGGMVGLAGAVAYWQARDLPAEEMALRMNALVLTQWLAAGLLVVGAGYYLVADRKGRGEA
ncbi:MAG: zinc-ribbon domain-containing protein [Chloroflexota bacterium]|nr:zinc-ribbon domain-containing protein [Chloroflexota bacterium]